MFTKSHAQNVHKTLFMITQNWNLLKCSSVNGTDTQCTVYSYNGLVCIKELLRRNNKVLPHEKHGWILTA